VINNPGQFNTGVTGLPYGEDPPGPPGAKTTFLWTVTYTWRGKTCVDTDTIVITALGYNYADGSQNAGNNEIICTDSFPQLKGVYPPDGLNGSWTVIRGNGVFDDSTFNETGVTGLDYGSNIFRWTFYRAIPGGGVVNGTNMCLSTADVEIYNASPSPADAGVDQFVCTNSAQLNARQQRVNPRPNNFASNATVTATSSKWTQPGGATGSIFDDTLYNTSVSGLGLGRNTFVWTLTSTVSIVRNALNPS
jgi:hypothetical protein